MGLTWDQMQGDDRNAGESYCWVCGCTQSHACYRRCFWVNEHLCSNCGSAYPHELHRELLLQAISL